MGYKFCQMVIPATHRHQEDLLFSNLATKRRTWWNIPLMSPLMATGCSLKRSSNPRSDALSVGPGRRASLRFRPLNWYEQLNTIHFFPLWLTMWGGMYHDSPSCVSSLGCSLRTEPALINFFISALYAMGLSGSLPNRLSVLRRLGITASLGAWKCDMSYLWRSGVA